MAFAMASFAQSPESFNYQAVARNASGQAIANTSISIQFKVRQGGASGTAIYSEEHLTTTNAMGLFNLAVGDGINPSMNFGDIDWASGPYFLEVLLDATGGSNYTSIGTSQLLSVPFALYAANGSKWMESQNGITYSETVGINSSSPYGAFNVLNTDGGPIFGPIFSHGTNGSSLYDRNTALSLDMINEGNSAAHTRILFRRFNSSSTLKVFSSIGTDYINNASGMEQGDIVFATRYNGTYSETMRISGLGLGVGTTQPKAAVHVSNGDVYIQDINKGIIMTDANGQCWRFTPNTNGELVGTPVACP